MFTLPRVPRLAALSAIAATVVLCAPAYALGIEFQDDAKLPSGLKWRKVSITSRHKYGTNFGNVTPQQQEYLYRLWSNEIDKNHKYEATECGKEISRKCAFPEEILFVEFQKNGIIHRFSSAYIDCALSDFGEVKTCKWIYEAIDSKTGKAAHTESFDMCAKTYDKATEFAIDKKKSKIHFRINTDNSMSAEFCPRTIIIK